MYYPLLLTHSLLRYVVLILLITLLVRSYLGWTGKKPFTATDNKVSLFTLIGAHTQFLIGLLLYFFASPFVQFNAGTMKDRWLRFWTVEHIMIMIIAIVLITVARSTMKKLPDDSAKHRRLFIFNLLALLCIITGIALSQRGFFGLPG